MIEILNLTKRFGSNTILCNNYFKFNKGEITTIVGMNGSGKTTLIQILLGIIEYDQMEMRIIKGGKTQNATKLRDVFYVPSDSVLPEYLTGSEYLSFVFKIYQNHDDYRLKLLIKLFDFENALKKLIVEYSYGMKKKLQIIVALSLNTSTLIFDEVHSGLDIEATYFFNSLIRKRANEGCYIIIATHDVHYANTATDKKYLLCGNGIVKEFIDQDIEAEIKNIIFQGDNNEIIKKY